MFRSWGAGILLCVGILAGQSVWAQEKAQEKVTILPSVNLSERYNSNVFMVSPSLLASGTKTDDFVTTITPQVVAFTDYDFGRANLMTRATFASYVRNPELNYVGVNAGLSLNLNRLVQKFDPNAGLQVFQGAMYAPVLPSFLGQSNPSSDGSGVNQASDQASFVRGLAAARQSALVLTSSIAASDRLTPRTTLFMNYQYDKATFLGNSISSTAPKNFDTSFQTASGGVRYLVTNNDNARISYSYAMTNYASGGGQTGANGKSFDSQGVSLGWSHVFSPFWNGSVNAGGSLVQPSEKIYQTYGANIFYRGEFTTATMSYSRVISPSYTAISAALVSEVTSVAFSHRLGAFLSGGASASYSKNEFVTTSRESFHSYQANTFLAYRVEPWMVTSLNYGYGFFDQEAATSRNTFNQQTVMLNLIIGAPPALQGAGGAPGMYR